MASKVGDMEDENSLFSKDVRCQEMQHTGTQGTATNWQGALGILYPLLGLRCSAIR